MLINFLTSILEDKNPEVENKNSSLEITQQLEEYIFSIAKGDKVALENLYYKTKGAVFGFALSILKNPYDTEDIVQEAYCLIYENAKKYKSNNKPMAWVFTIVKNLCMTKFRKNKPTIDYYETDLEDTLISQPTVSNDDKIVLNAFIKLLSQQEQQIITLYATCGYLHKEIAQILNMPISTVLSNYNRAIKKLREFFGKED